MRRQVGWYYPDMDLLIRMSKDPKEAIRDTAHGRPLEGCVPVYADMDEKVIIAFQDRQTTVAMAMANGDQKTAAMYLGISLRTLRRRIARRRKDDK